MNAVIEYYKKRFETPLDMLNRLRRERPEFQDEKLSYLGRLDPLASGVMLVAVGEANKEREKYLGLAKTYKVQFLFGISTDTGDVLGRIEHMQPVYDIDQEKIKKAITNMVGKHALPYPRYSSKTVLGTPLHKYAREGVAVDVPFREMEIISLVYKGKSYITGRDVVLQGVEATARVRGDFRQDEITKEWEHFETMYGDMSCLITDVEMRVTSGTYIRSLANVLAKVTDVPCLAYRIERIAIHGSV